MIRRYSVLVLALATLLAGLSGCSRGNGITADTTVKVNQPNSFASYINKVASLPSGDYTIVAATSNPGQSGDYTLTVTQDDGSVQTYTGSWTSSGGQDPASSSNPQYPISIYDAGGIDIKLESSVDTYLYLVSANSVVFAENDDIALGTNKNSEIKLASSRIDSEAFGAAYYAAIDPTNAKTTLADWMTMNGYDAAYNAIPSRVIQPRFRDTKDLGYGRGMRVWTRPDGSFYAYVENFQVRTVPGLEYTSTNLDALIENDRQHHFGSNAIEYSTYPYGPGEPCAWDSGNACATSNHSPKKFAKFYTFDASQANKTTTDYAHEVRLNTVNLDGRGNKTMPNACAYCHGGTVRPLRPDGSFRDNTLDGTSGNGLNGDVNAKLQFLEVPSFEYWDKSPYTKAEEEAPIKQVNEAVYCTYPNLPSAAIPVACAQYCVDPANTADCDGKGDSLEAVVMCRNASDTANCDIDALGAPVDLLTVQANADSQTYPAGRWTGEFAREMAEGWYDDPSKSGYFDSPTFVADYVPQAWRPNPATGNPPAGSDKLFADVVEPVCFQCHSRRGTSLGSNSAVNGSKDIDFSSYDKFISHAALIKKYVFDYGVMPLSLRGHEAFWGNNDSPLLLASQLNARLAVADQIKANSAGYIDKPGAPIVDAGPDITTTSPVLTFGANSRFVDTYSWSIVSTPAGGETATLTDADKPRSLLTAPVDGDYVLRLIASYKAGGKSAQDTVTIKINSSASPAPKDLTFLDNIEPVMAANCVSCHSQGGAAPGIPMWWTLVNQPATGTTMYQELLTRVDFSDPENSPVLQKPSGHHHYGGLITGFEIDNPANRANYDLFLNWIMNGARYSTGSMRE